MKSDIAASHRFAEVAIFSTPRRRDAGEKFNSPRLYARETDGATVAPDMSPSERATWIEKTLDRISLMIIQAAIKIHRRLGPGLLESMYRACMVYELRERGLTVATEHFVPFRYKNLVMDCAYRIDLLVEGW